MSPPRLRRARRSPLMVLTLAKKAAREAAFARRAAAHAAGAGAAERAAAHALALIGALADVASIAAYLPIRTEIDSQPLLRALFASGYRLGVPVIQGPDMPLRFRAWTPEAEIVIGPYGIHMPASGERVEPDLLIVPLVAFDARGYRLGYGGGFYDRTLAGLRARRVVRAYGFAYAGQRMEDLPVGPEDAHLDAVITEAGLVFPS